MIVKELVSLLLKENQDKEVEICVGMRVYEIDAVQEEITKDTFILNNAVLLITNGVLKNVVQESAGKEFKG